MGWACDDKVVGTIVERNTNLRVIREILVHPGNVRLKVLKE